MAGRRWSRFPRLAYRRIDGPLEEQACSTHHETAAGLEAPREGQKGGQEDDREEVAATNHAAPLDGAAGGAISTASLGGPWPTRGTAVGNWLERLRDRIVVRSQVGKRKLDAVFTRRELDRKLVEVGQLALSLIREGRVKMPQEIVEAVAEARLLEDRLATQRAEIAAMESEAV